MTPDMKRLCLATIKAHDEWYGDRFSITPAGAEEIVRAVLMALRETSDAVKKAAEEGTEFYGAGENISYDAGETIARAVDFILGTDARRATALQDLADIDRDLL